MSDRFSTYKFECRLSNGISSFQVTIVVVAVPEGLPLAVTLT